jgi:hypothetical protein
MFLLKVYLAHGYADIDNLTSHLELTKEKIILISTNKLTSTDSKEEVSNI